MSKKLAAPPDFWLRFFSGKAIRVEGHKLFSLELFLNATGNMWKCSFTEISVRQFMKGGLLKYDAASDGLGYQIKLSLPNSGNIEGFEAPHLKGQLDNLEEQRPLLTEEKKTMCDLIATASEIARDVASYQFLGTSAHVVEGFLVKVNPPENGAPRLEL